MLLSPLQSSFVVSRWLLPEYPCQVPLPTLPFHLPIHILTAFNNDRLSYKYSNGSSIGVSRSASSNAANSSRFELEPSSSRPTLHYCFFLFLLKLLYPAPILPFCLICLNRHLPLLGPETPLSMPISVPIAFFPFQSYLTFVFSS